MRTTSLTLALVAVFVTAPSTASAATRYVDDDGVQCGAAQFPTISHAITNSAPGDTIYVCPGTYREQVIAHHGVRILGVDRDTTIIRQVAPGKTGVSLRRGALLSKVTVQGAAAGVGVAMREGILRHSHVTGFANGVHGTTLAGYARGQVINNLIEGHTNAGVVTTGGASLLADSNDIGGDRYGILVVGGRDGRFQRNAVAGGESGIHITNGSYGNIVRKNTVLLGGCTSTETLTNGPETRWEDNVGGNCATMS